MKNNYLILVFCLISSYSISQNSELEIKVFLEGPFSSYQMIPYLNVFDELPTDQPFNTSPWNYNGNESVSVFPTFDIVDWILIDVIKFQGGDDIKAVELVERRAGLLMKDGKVRDIDAISNLTMDLDGLTQIYIRIQHRNHLSIISSNLISESDGKFQYDFSLGPNQSLGSQHTQKQLSATAWGMIAADANANGQIDNKDKNEDWLIQNGLSGYYSGDFNMDSKVNDDDKVSQWDSNLGHASIATRDTIVPPFRCGDSLLDARDGKKYATIQIGLQCWMKDNLNVGSFITGNNDQTDNGIIEKHCYNNEPDSCNLFGGMYMWDEMMQYDSDTAIKGICPPEPGWYLPTDFDWKVLEGNADSQFPVGNPEWNNQGYRGFDAGGHIKEKSNRFWLEPNAGATNSTDFTALGGGIKYENQDLFDHLGQSGIYWSSDLYNINNPYFREFHFSIEKVNRLFTSKSRSHSVRCINTTKGINYPPFPPYNPSPEDISMDIDTDTTLMWACSDPEGDDITYNIYFGLDANPPLVATDHPDTLFNPGTLMMDSTYFWKIVAYDIAGDSTEGPVWSFTVRSFLCGDVLIDERDDQYYNTVQIGLQCWMAENLNIGTRIDGINQPTDDEIIEKYCYNDLEDSCDVYGGLYQWNEMMQYTTIEGATGICPEDWYLPSDEEWKQLEGEVDSQFDYPDPSWDIEGWRGYDVGLNLKSQNGWFADVNGLDVVGFTAKPAGLYDFSTLSFQSVSQVTAYWSSSDNINDFAALRYLAFNEATSLRVFNLKNYGFSVRCLRDPYADNIAPSQPYNPSPEDGSMDIDTDTTLMWACSDPEDQDITYNIYFGLDANPPLVATDHPDTLFNPGTLMMDSTYFWKIVAYDIASDSTEGPVWSFTVRSFLCGDVLIDERDDQYYNTAQIGLQCWMAENLNIGTRIDGINQPTDDEIIEKYCYNDLEDSCDVYGGLYQWNEMMQYTTIEGATGICPEDWYLPSDEEWKQLEGEVDSQFGYPDPFWDIEGWRGYDVGLNLKSQNGWFADVNGLDAVGFTAKPAGLYDFGTFSFQSVSQVTAYWSSSDNINDFAALRYLAFNEATSLRVFNLKNYGFSVRCLRDPYADNIAPSQPYNPSPEDGSMDIDTDTTLMWACSDPEDQDITYNIYFGLDANPPLVATDHPDTLFNPGTLMMDSTYFWKIVAYDIAGDSTEGPVWSFTVRSFLCGDILIDERDDQYYNTAQIGLQCWMAENLNIGTRIDGINQPTDDEIIEKYCYNDLEDSCDVYGGLYQWNEMMQYTTIEGATGICPEDWYLPSDEEWKQLEGEVDSQFGYPDPFWDIEGWRGYDVGLNLKSQNGWFADVNGLDAVGFTAKPAGLYDFSTLSFQSVSQITAYWSSSDNVSDLAAQRYMSFDNAMVLRVFNVKLYGFSVRCIKNETTKK